MARLSAVSLSKVVNRDFPLRICFGDRTDISKGVATSPTLLTFVLHITSTHLPAAPLSGIDP